MLTIDRKNGCINRKWLNTKKTAEDFEQDFHMFQVSSHIMYNPKNFKYLCYQI
jgi:hypothetical protein